MRYLKGTVAFGLFYPKSFNFDLISYSNVDFVGSKSDRKSTSGTCHLLGHYLVSQFSKKHNCVSLSTTEAEYIAASSACTQVIQIKQTLHDFGLYYDTTNIFYDNTSAINLSKNLVMHSRTKHIQIRHHFIHDQVLNKIIKLEFVPTTCQLANIFTKPLKTKIFSELGENWGFVVLQIYDINSYVVL